MVIICAANGCFKSRHNTNPDEVIFHRFPLKRPDLVAKWVKAIKRNNFKPTANSYLCSDHFKDSDYEPKSNGKSLKMSSVPTIFDPKLIKKKRKQSESENEDTETDSKSEEDDDDMEETLDRDDNQEIHEKDDKSELAGLISRHPPGTLQLLIVGDDGGIMNSELFFKKETDIEVQEHKPDLDVLNTAMFKGPVVEMTSGDVDMTQDVETSAPVENEEITTNDNCQNKSLSSLNMPNQINTSRSATEHSYNHASSNAEVTKLAQKLVTSRKKIKYMQMRIRRLDKRVSELKMLLKLLVLKRGKGQKNIDQLFEEYARNEKIETAQTIQTVHEKSELELLEEELMGSDG